MTLFDEDGAESESGSAAFDELRRAMRTRSALRRETESAFQVLVNRVNPSDRGQRFVVGAAAEWILAAAAWSADVLTVPGGHGVDGFDLKDVENGARGLWSVKASFSRTKPVFRITNGLGGAGRGLTDPTVFLSPHLPGIVLVHHERHPETVAKVVPRSDATELPLSAVLGHAGRHPECVIALDVPFNEGRGTEDAALIFTKSLLSPTTFPLLSDIFTKSERVQSDVTSSLERLVAMRASGALSGDEYESAKRKLLN